MNAAARQQFIEALDPVFTPHGFKHNARTRQWKRRFDDRTTDGVHVNIGKALITPSISVRYHELDGMLSEELMAWPGTAVTFAEVTTRVYDLSTPPMIIEEDFVHDVLPYIEALHDRDAVIRALMSEDSRSWPVTGCQFRVRLLPLLLISRNRKKEARAVVDRFRADGSDPDQLRPPFDEYAAAIERLIR